MHSMCLVVMQKMCKYYFKVSRVKTSTENIIVFNERIEEISPYIPTQFAHKPRPSEYLENWKATDFRQVLLYTG